MDDRFVFPHQALDRWLTREPDFYNEEDTIMIDYPEFHGHPMFLDLTEDELKLHSEKNRDYARHGDPLGNFKRVSAVLKAQGINLTPAQVAMVFAQKQQDAAMQMIAYGYEGDVENVDTRLRDVHIYYKIARILYAEEKNEGTCD